MGKNKNPKINIPLLLVIAIAIAFGWIIYVQQIKSSHLSATNSHVEDQSSIVQYASEDLHISLAYPKGWNIDDRYQSILLTDYPTSLNKNDKPTRDQLEIYIREYSNCHPTIEEDLQDPGCGEGGSSVPLNQIKTKETRQVPGGTFYKYVIQSPYDKEFTYYLLEHGDRVLQIEKHPDPSQHEKEFETIVSSIKFLE